MEAVNIQTLEKIIDASVGNANKSFHLAPSFTFEQARNLLGRCYRKVVAERGGSLITDDDTVRHVEEMARWLTDPNGTTSGIMLQGTMGNGKTSLMYAFQRLMGAMNNIPGSFPHLGQYFKPTTLILHSKAIVEMCLEDNKAYRELANRDMLGIDDLGTEAPEVEKYRNVMQPVVDLLENRYQRRKFTIVTTNLPMTSQDIVMADGSKRHVRGLDEHYGARVKDRMLEMFFRIKFTNGSYRGRQT